MLIPLRIDEDDKTPAQLAQRERTYQAAKLLRTAGFECEVVEYFTGEDSNANAAGIVLKAQRGE